VTSPTEAAPSQHTGPRRWIALAFLLTSSFLAVLSNYIANVAIPALERTLHASYVDVEFMVTGYIVMYAVFLVPGGRLGDMYGRKRVYIAGMAIFSLASLVCGLAPDAPVMIAGRVVQGLGAALMYPQVLGVIQRGFFGRDRDLALGLFGGTLGIAATLGQLIGGGLIALDLGGLSWRPAFLLMVPLAAASAVGAGFVMRNRGSAGQGGVDLAGAALLATILGCVMIPLIAGREAGWPPVLVATLLASLPLAPVLAAVERVRAAAGRVVLLAPALFRHPGFVAALAVMLAFTVGNNAFNFLLSVTLQLGLGLTPFQAGLVFIPLGGGFLVTAMLLPQASKVFRERQVPTGLVIVGLSQLAVFLILSVAHAPLAFWLPALAAIGLGQGLVLTPLIGTALTMVPTSDSGVASGMLTTTTQVGNAAGIAVGGLVFFAALAGAHTGTSTSESYRDALGVSMLVFVAMNVSSFVLTFGLPRRSEPALAAVVGAERG
jgi:MFS family permease